jgi:hypothetical protein
MMIKEVKTWKPYPGKKEYLLILAGKPVTMKQAITAECYSCTAGYFDGRKDCHNKTCALYPFMRYRKDKPKKERSESQRQADVKAGFRLKNVHRTLTKKNSE